MEEVGVLFLNQLVSSMETAIKKLEEAKNSKDKESFNSAKKLILEIQKKIEEY